MRWLLFLSVLTVGLYKCAITSDVIKEEYNVLFESGKHGLLAFVPSRKRVTREIGGAGSKLPHIENRIKELCANDKRLNDSMATMKTCLKKKPVFLTPRDEFIENIDHCSVETRNELRKCLPEKLRYFPDFFFNLVDSVVKLLYDDFGEIARGLAPCVSKLNEEPSKTNYEKCLKSTGEDIQEEILESKEKFCGKFLEAANCFIKQLNDTCTTNEDLEKFKKDYIAAVKRPCK
ncbi:uncharacterized protein LOC108905821 isoform X2 [Anoplophora glabripennis]|uniref:uncharacterized protein LOC108905821 isoform X2 n=1 Tax=Anoplophora glabripennis TaxID=217634 RepID=UPI000C77CA5F|nr:uncharacterized protein LOC108905821 isoform X2 [Anoplophora glabripennis]